jgi:hypothetical protein
MYTQWSPKKPHENVGPEIGSEKNSRSKCGIKKIKNGTEKEQRNSVGHQMIKASMKQRAHEYSDQTWKGTGYDSKVA